MSSSRPAGSHSRPWRGDDEAGRALADGVYFIRMQVVGVVLTRRTVPVR